MKIFNDDGSLNKDYYNQVVINVMEDTASSTFESISGKVYEALIKYAVKTSDAFMFMAHENSDFNLLLQELKPFLIKIRKPAPKGTAYFMEGKEFEDFYLMSDCTDEDINSYRKMIDHEINICAKKGIGWPGNIGQTDQRYDIYLFKSDVKVLPILLKSEKLADWKAPQFPEDLCFFRNNECWLFTVSHEEILSFTLKSYDEYDLLKSIGVKFSSVWSDYKELNSIAFHETY